MKWKKHWDEYPTKFQETEYFKQVGKTVSGNPISDTQFRGIISDISAGLNIGREDTVLDMCCGNGIITTEISKDCKSVVGIDYSDHLIRVAQKFNKPENVSYFCASVLEKDLKKLFNKPFTKIYMYEALQHFNEDDFVNIVDLIGEISSTNSTIFFGSVPDKDKLWDFYNTAERRDEYIIRQSENNDALGTWWSQKYIVNICLNKGFEVEFLPQNPILHTSHYRFDFRLTKLRLRNV